MWCKIDLASWIPLRSTVTNIDAYLAFIHCRYNVLVKKYMAPSNSRHYTLQHRPSLGSFFSSPIFCSIFRLLFLLLRTFIYTTPCGCFHRAGPSYPHPLQMAGDCVTFIKKKTLSSNARSPLTETSRISTNPTHFRKWKFPLDSHKQEIWSRWDQWSVILRWIRDRWRP